MNNFMIGFKRFITNKNVVSVLGVLIVLGVLYWGYSSTIKKATNPVNVPVAAKVIGPQTEITASDIVYKKIAASMIDESVIVNTVQLLGRYTNVNVTIPQGSVFYTNWVVNAEDVPGNWIEQLDKEKEELGYYMSVNMATTLGNSILPDSYIDIYMKATDENGTIMFGKLLKNIKVLVVHDSSGQNVFKDSSNIGTPSKIGFGLTKELYVLLKKAEYLNLELVIAPRGITVPQEDSVIVTSATLRDYVDAKTIPVEEEDIIEEENDIEENLEVQPEQNIQENVVTQ